MMTTRFHLTQLNLARAKAPLDHPLMEGFVVQLDALNALAEASPGFAWRLKTQEGDATALRVENDPRLIVNLSVWASLEALRSYVFEGPHLHALRRRREWFDPLDSPSLVLWWTLPARPPSLQLALRKLDHLRVNGPTQEAFTFGRPFPAPVVGALDPVHQ